MAMHAEAVLIHPVHIVVLAHVDAVAVMISIAAPHEIMIPQFLVVAEPIGEERIRTEYRRREEKIENIKGEPPSPLDLPPGCPFSNRCPHCTERCEHEKPKLVELTPGHEVACHRFAK